MAAKTKKSFPWTPIVLIVVAIPIWLLGATAGAANAQIMIGGSCMLILGLLIGNSVLVYGHIGELEGRIRALEQIARDESAENA